MEIDERAPAAAYWAVLPATVLASPTLGDKAKLIYAEISRMIGPRGYCWARDKYLAERVGCSTRTVSRAIHDLEAAGAIRVEMSANHNGTERHIYAGLSPAAPSEAPESAEKARGGIDTSGETPQGGIDTSGETRIDKYGETPQATQYNMKNINNKYRRTSAPGREIAPEAAIIFKTWAGDDRELLQRLAAMATVRAANKKPYKTAQQAKLLVNKLKRIAGQDRALMIQVLDEAIEHGWLTVYPPKDPTPSPAAAGGLKEAPDVALWEPDDGGGHR